MATSQHATHLSCQVEFAVETRPAMLLRITPKLRAALTDAHATGQQAFIRFSGTNSGTIITVGAHQFEVVANPEGTCELMKLPPPGSTLPAVEVGVVQQKLLVKRNLEEERERRRAQAADEHAQPWHSVLLPDGSAPDPTAAAAKRRTNGLQGASLRARSASPAPLRAASPVAKADIVRDQSLVGHLEPAGKTPLKKWRNQPKSKLGLKLPRSAAAKAGSASAAAVSVSADALAAARLSDRKRALRLCMIALLAAKPVTRQWVEQAVAEVTRAVPGFKATPEQWRGEAGRVGEYHAPGVYHLRPGMLAELDVLRHATPPPADKMTARETAAASPASTAAKSGKARPAAPSGADDLSGKAAKKRLRKAEDGVQPGQDTGKSKSRERKPTSTFNGDSRVQDAVMPDDALQDAALHRRRSSPQPHAVPLATAATEHAALPGSGADVAVPSPTPSPRALADFPSSCSPLGNTSPVGFGAPRIHSRSGSLAGQSGSRGMRSSSSAGSAGGSRSSQLYDETWFSNHVHRQPALAPPCATQQQFANYRDSYNEKYPVYFRVHQELAAHRRDIEALRAAAATASPGSPERAQWLSQLERLWQRRRERCIRWEAAHWVLNTELQSIKGAMRQFVAEQRGAAAEAAAHAPGSSATNRPLLPR